MGLLYTGSKSLGYRKIFRKKNRNDSQELCTFSLISALSHRLKSFGFNEQEIAVEIPKPLQLADVAVRVMWPPYDPLTRQVKRLSGNGADKHGPDGVDIAERLSTVADTTVESVQLENNEVHTCVCSYMQ